MAINKTFPIQKLPEELIDKLFLLLQDIETYRSLTSIKFFERYFQKYKFFIADKDKKHDSFSGIQFTYSKDYIFGDLTNTLKVYQFTRFHENGENDFKGFKFCILRIRTCISDGDSLSLFCKLLSKLKIFYFVEIEFLCSCLRSKFQYGTWDALLLTPFLKGITFRTPDDSTDFDLLQLKVLQSTDMLAPDQHDFLIQPHLSLRRLVLRFEGEKVPNFVLDGFQNIPLILLNLSLRNPYPLKIIKQFSLTIKKLVILHLTDSKHDLVFDNMQFPCLEHVYLESITPRKITFKNSQFPVLVHFGIKTEPHKPELVIQRCSFDKLSTFVVPNAGFKTLMFKNNQFPKLQCLPVESSGFQSIEFKANYWPLVNKTREQILEEANKIRLKRRNSDESDW